MNAPEALTPNRPPKCDKQLLAMPVAPQLASGLSQTYLHRLVATLWLSLIRASAEESLRVQKVNDA
ncbi:unnamed protein product [Clonostachys chloroleuca]|uniref:Uncharacterized protein n=1 Tax=Clonostachys chloroleuca TaxID=1926264 RepID=A0AA35MCQ2_9HYPO|nr:unnamed protein product [Clonostachys chloroleuca]